MTVAVLGLDLHGTLLDRDERFPPSCLDAICRSLDALSGKVSTFTCTGNDLHFVTRVLPRRLVEMLSGFVLETGCTFSNSPSGPERLLVPAEIISRRNELEKRLKRRGFRQVTRFGRRLATVSLFTPEPAGFHRIVSSILKDWCYDDFFATYSSVAVDIVPKGYDKLTGIRAVAGDAPVVAVADSVNDIPFLSGADLALAPANLAEEAATRLERLGRNIRKLDDWSSACHGDILVASKPETLGVVEILEFLRELDQFQSIPAACCNGSYWNL